MNYDAQSLDAVIKSKQDIMLSPHFKLSELIRTSQKADNWPATPEEILKLQYVCIWILEKVRAHFGKPVSVNSGYRSKAVNALVKGATFSQHMKAEAVDFEIPGVANGDIAMWIRDNLVFDQLILECYTAGKPSSGWVHCSVIQQNNRKEVKTAKKNAQSGKMDYSWGLNT